MKIMNRKSLPRRQTGKIINHPRHMKISAKSISFFEEKITDFFRKAGREHLPWRKKRISAYEVWVSEIMLQQTQVVRVIGYYERFLKRFPTIEALASATWEAFLPYYEGLGYYNRGRNMLKAAKEVTTKHQGRFPRDAEALRRLPGIGPYTAAAIMSFAYGDDHLAWDTNLHRVIGRFFYGTKSAFFSNPSVSTTRQLPLDPLRRSESEARKGSRKREGGMTNNSEAFWEDKFVTPKKSMNAALMDFGSALCVARPKCEACSLRQRCAFYRDGGKLEAVEKNKRRISYPVSRITGNGNRGGIRHTTYDIRHTDIDWREAKAVVFLHENHKKYFSSVKKEYKPFVLPSGYNTRAGIKKYFLEKYGLQLAVRPPHEKKLIKGQSMLFVNAQILLGTPSFSVFPKNVVEGYNESMKS